MALAMAVGTTAVAQNKVKNIYANTSKLNVEMLQKGDQTVQLNRYFFAGYNTLCLPMSLTAQQVAAAAKDLRVERLAAINQEGATLNLYFVDCTAEGIQAGQPYLVYSPTSQYLRVRNTDVQTVDGALQTVRMSDGRGNTVAFGSSWEAIEKAGRYGIPAQQNVTPLESVLIKTNADKRFLPTRCGFTWDEQSSSATELEIKHVTSLDAMGTTALQRVADKNATVDVYDTKGTLVKKGVRINEAKKSLPRGIYVVGGEKIAVQ